MSDEPNWCFVQAIGPTGKTHYVVPYKDDQMQVANVQSTMAPLLIDCADETRLMLARDTMMAQRSFTAIEVIYLDRIPNPVSDELEERTRLAQRMGITRLTKTEIDALGLTSARVNVTLGKP